MPLFYFVYAKLFKVKMSVVFDIFVISLISTLMLARFNCILSGCCLGTQIFDTELLWPTREMEIFFYLILIYIFDKIISENKSYGNIYPIYMISYGIFRGLIEFLRVGEGLIHRAHYWSILSIIIGSIIVFVLNKQKRGK